MSIIEQSIDWARNFDKSNFPTSDFRNYRREINKYRYALKEKCSIGAYGESQVGKSYLMSSLLSKADSPFVIVNGGKEYIFIDEINPSGGNNTNIESTGVITRFTIDDKNNNMKDYIKIENLSIVDIILVLTDSYYNDLKINADSTLSYTKVNEIIQTESASWKSESAQEFITEDDILDIQDYIKEFIGNGAISIIQSDFFKTTTEIIRNIPSDNWPKVFSLLWNRNENITRLFSELIKEYRKLNFKTEVYVPFSAVLRNKGTLLKIQWLDLVCGVHNQEISEGEELTTDVYNENGTVLASKFSKAFLSAFISELTFVLPQSIAKDRPFLEDVDLLDFPGARSREKVREEEIANVLPKILRRGKVAYLFNKYSRELKISSILFCHHNNQKSEPTLGETINSWIEKEIGKTAQERAVRLKKTDGISPLFVVATKFNIDLEMIKNERKGELQNHWKRFDTVLPEIIKPYRWFDNWVEKGTEFNSEFFQNIYPLRDFYWSGKNGLFAGYDDRSKSPEKEIIKPKNFPEYFDELKKSFIENPFVKNHFANPEQTWNDVATINNDGSSAIIQQLNKIAKLLDNSRKVVYMGKLSTINRRIKSALDPFYDPDNDEERARKLKTINRDIFNKLELVLSQKQEVFGKILDTIMIKTEDLRYIARDILMLKVETPKDYSEINYLRIRAGINTQNTYEENLEKLLKYNQAEDEKDLEEIYRQCSYSYKDIIQGDFDSIITTSDLLANKLIEKWVSHLEIHIKELEEYLAYTDEIVRMYKVLINELNIKNVISSKIKLYENQFEDREKVNAIADYSTLTLNSMISTMGRKFMTEEQIREIEQKANSCNIKVDLSQEAIEAERKTYKIEETLNALTESEEILKSGNGATKEAEETFKMLPFWDNSKRWQNLLSIGLILASGVSASDPKSNSAIKAIIDNNNSITLQHD